MNILSKTNDILNKKYVGFSNSGVKVKNPALVNISVIDLFAALKYIPDGEKDGSYFTRAAFTKGVTTRNTENMETTSNVIILDADSTEGGDGILGAPCPYKVSENLKVNGVYHLIIRSYSHQMPGYGNRYRILIPTATPYNNKQLADMNAKALYLCGEPIKNVSENNVWAQPWYFPRKKESGAIK